MTEIKKASCAVGNEMLILPDDAERVTSLNATAPNSG